MALQVRVLTHCNTGALACGGIGTALGIIRVLHNRKALEHTYNTETRCTVWGVRCGVWVQSRVRGVGCGVQCRVLVQGSVLSVRFRVQCRSEGGAKPGRRAERCSRPRDPLQQAT